MPKNDTPPSFAELIEDAQNAPDLLGAPPPGDIASPFGSALPAGHRLVDTSKEELKLESPTVVHAHYSKVYNLCNAAESAEYDEQHGLIANSPFLEKATKNKPMLTLRKDETHVTKDGDWLALLQWVSSYPSAVRKRRLLQPMQDDSED